ncbi:MAG: PspC domain-containing protein [Bacteroidales bacterium]|nr:PspC domain-containing protein [Bacteroidales bacterium]
MNRVEKLSIGGYAFNLEEDAAKMVTEYVENLRKCYSGTSDASEIVEAFEDRICEMLLENHPSDSVVTVADIEAVKAALGTPEAIVSSSEGEDSGFSGAAGPAEKPQWWKNDTRKRIFRPRTGRIFGGVCSGLAAYFNIDVTALRIIWALMLCTGLFFDSIGIFSGISGFALLGYLLLWICMPRATESQEMLYAKNHDNGERNQALYIFGRILKVCIGLLFILTGSVGMAVGVAAISGLNLLDLATTAAPAINDILDVLPGLVSVKAIKTLPLVLAVCYFIPCILFLYEGIRLCFGFRSPSWHPGLILTIIWIIAVISFCLLIGLSVIPSLTA